MRVWDICKWIIKFLLCMINEGLYNVGIVWYRFLLLDIYDVILGSLCFCVKFVVFWIVLCK